MDKIVDKFPYKKSLYLQWFEAAIGNLILFKRTSPSPRSQGEIQQQHLLPHIRPRHPAQSHHFQLPQKR